MNAPVIRKVIEQLVRVVAPRVHLVDAILVRHDILLGRRLLGDDLLYDKVLHRVVRRVVRGVPGREGVLSDAHPRERVYGDAVRPRPRPLLHRVIVHDAQLFHSLRART